MIEIIDIHPCCEIQGTEDARVDVDFVEGVIALVAVVPGVVNLIDDEFKDLLAIVVIGVLITFITESKPFLISSLIAFKLKSDIVISSSSKATVLS